MTLQELMNLLNSLEPDEPIGIQIKDICTKEIVDESWTIGFSYTDDDQLLLSVDTEKEKFM
ncbi:hypothetical protein [Enterococcus casseliflavus]|uniref:Uncharacterized protein n=1 Tax=Enterococcus casseliflavus TaxID=37734 RepID=A0ABD6Z4Q1_ENTCA|nr:hypothetical protein [Enterococcus casseliflavus]QGN31465.1 hypothetical protein GFU50_18470 [Enterococcus casseliflavus]